MVDKLFLLVQNCGLGLFISPW